MQCGRIYITVRVYREDGARKHILAGQQHFQPYVRVGSIHNACGCIVPG